MDLLAPLAADLEAAAGRTGLPDLVPYDLRRTFVSLMLSCGCRRGEVADQAGHSLAVMEKHYALTIAEYRGVSLADPAAVIHEARAARVLQGSDVAALSQGN
jgi:integrase